MEIIMVRHTRVNLPEGTCYGWTDVPLADTFPREAEETKRCLMEMGVTPACEAYSSPLTRARLLAEYCGFHDIKVDERLKEMYMGDWEMATYNDLTGEEIERWYKDFMHVATPHGESFPMLYRRVTQFMDELTKDVLGEGSERRVVIFTHGGVLMAAGIWAGLFPAEDCFSHLVGNGGIQVITV